MNEPRPRGSKTSDGVPHWICLRCGLTRFNHGSYRCSCPPDLTAGSESAKVPDVEQAAHQREAVAPPNGTVS